MAGCSATGQKQTLTLGEVVRVALPDFSQSHRLPVHHWKVLRAISACQTPALGGHKYRCSFCGQEHFVPNSCGNRHCPSCQKLQSAQWLEEQIKHLLPIPYFHVVFTLPHELNPLIQYNQERLYGLLFASAPASLLEFGRNHLQATLGITAVLHTWSQTLLDHYHLHCVVTGRGLALEGQRWVSTSPKWLCDVQARSSLYRAKFRQGLERLFKKGQLQFPPAQAHLAEGRAFQQWLDKLCVKGWVVYAKRPLAGPEVVLAYLCRYTHRVGISNGRLQRLDLEQKTVTFNYKDYADGGRIRSMTLGWGEFLRRFCLHILPARFVKIRNYGLLSNRGRATRIAQARSLLGEAGRGLQQQLESVLNLQQVEPPPLVCPHCGRLTLVLVAVIERPETPAISDTS
jgi:hypothetical protein